MFIEEDRRYRKGSSLHKTDIFVFCFVRGDARCLTSSVSLGVMRDVSRALFR